MHILVPTDGSEVAENALNYILELRKGRSTRYTVLAAFDVPLAVDVPMDSLETEAIMREGVETRLKRKCEELSVALKEEPFHFEYNVVAGGLVPALELVLTENHIDLVVMGTGGADGALADLLGTNAADAASNISTPLLVVPNAAAFCGFREVVLAADNKVNGPASVLAPLVEMLNGFNAEVFILNVLDPGMLTSVDEAVEGLKTDIALEQVKHSFHFTHGSDKVSAIIDWTRGRGAELLACVPHQRGFWQSLFHNSVTRGLVMHAPVPVLVLPGN